MFQIALLSSCPSGRSTLRAVPLESDSKADLLRMKRALSEAFLWCFLRGLATGDRWGPLGTAGDRWGWLGMAGDGWGWLGTPGTSKIHSDQNISQRSE